MSTISYINLFICLSFSLFLLRNIFYNLFFPRHAEKRKRRMINKIGLSNSINFSLFYCSFYLSFFIFAIFYAANKYIWIILSLIYLFILVFALIAYVTNENKNLTSPKFDDKSFERSIKSRRIFAIMDSLILLLWILSWYNQIIH